MCNNCCVGRNCLVQWRSWIRPLVMFCYVCVLLIVLPFLIIRLQQNGTAPHDQAWFIGGIFVFLALPITFWEITQHLVHYTKPYLQKHIIRILWMVPIYALNAWLGLLYPEQAIYLDTCRECYEAYVIYNFMTFLLNFLNATIFDLERQLESKEQVKHIFPLCCLPPWKMGKTLINYCRHGTLQYTVVRPVITIIALICELAGVYGEGQFTAKVAFPYLLAINNLSQFVAMYSLIYFYRANKDELAPMDPIWKFLCIKSVVFFSFFQGVIITILVQTGVISESFTTKDDKVVKAVSSSLQDFLICIEMFLAAVAHLYAFSYKPYVDPESDHISCWDSFKAMWDVSDVSRDVSDHIRTVGSTVQRSVTRRRTPIKDGVADERTRLLPEKHENDPYTESIPQTSDHIEQAIPATSMLSSESCEQEDVYYMDSSGPVERSLIDFSADKC